MAKRNNNTCIVKLSFSKTLGNQGSMFVTVVDIFDAISHSVKISSYVAFKELIFRNYKLRQIFIVHYGVEDINYNRH